MTGATTEVEISRHMRAAGRDFLPGDRVDFRTAASWRNYDQLISTGMIRVVPTMPEAHARPGYGTGGDIPRPDPEPEPSTEASVSRATRSKPAAKTRYRRAKTEA